MFSLFRNACFVYKMSKLVFSRFIFTIYDMGIQGDTRGSNRLKWVTVGYRGLQGVTRGYKGLQGITRDLQCVPSGNRALQTIIKTLF